MEGTYQIWLGKESVGQAVVERIGLYYYFRCCCQLHSEVMCRVTITCGSRNENLGILIPTGGNYTLNKKLPIKQFDSNIPEFWIIPRSQAVQSLRIDVYPEEPFRYITKLETAYLDSTRDGHKITINIL